MGSTHVTGNETGNEFVNDHESTHFYVTARIRPSKDEDISKEIWLAEPEGEKVMFAGKLDERKDKYTQKEYSVDK